MHDFDSLLNTSTSFGCGAPPVQADFLRVQRRSQALVSHGPWSCCAYLSLPKPPRFPRPYLTSRPWRIMGSRCANIWRQAKPLNHRTLCNAGLHFGNGRGLQSGPIAPTYSAGYTDGRPAVHRHGCRWLVVIEAGCSVPWPCRVLCPPHYPPAPISGGVLFQLSTG